MDEIEEINIWDMGVKLPTGGHWVDLPGSLFQVMTRDIDTLGTMYIRSKPIPQQAITLPCHFWTTILGTSIQVRTANTTRPIVLEIRPAPEGP